MDIKKGIKFVAIGFLFTLVNFNLKFNGNATMNVMPDFIGWLLFFLAFDKLGMYVDEKKYLKWMSLCLIILSAVAWLLDMIAPELEIQWYTTIVGIVEAVYIFLFFGPLENIANDYQCKQEDMIHTLRYVNVTVFAILALAELLAGVMSVASIVSVAIVFSVIGIVAAIVTCITLFKLSKEINQNELS